MQFYRPDIDGLRAVAIIPVVLFHANVPGFSGGFVGVDVFLVISGFLITSIIQREIVEGRFTVARFYERRARRILPAFFFMMVAVVIGAALLLLPHQYLAHSRAVVAATLFLSSFLFRSEDGYFDLSSEEKPLLHTWSLSVEEVFYVFFPLIILLSARYAARRQLLVLGVIGALSFMVSVVTLHQDNASKAAFFLPHFRAWEFLLGAVLALSPWAELRVSKLQEGMAALGLVMILVAVIVYSKETVFPGLSALLPCLGASLVIYSGRSRLPVIGRWLAHPRMVYIGLISYSLYLWHWPLLIFARLAYGGELTWWLTLSVVFVSVILATLSLRFVERPFRGSGALLTSSEVFRFSALGMSVFVAIGLHGMWTKGWSARFPPEVAAILFAEKDRDPRQHECLNTRDDANGCVYGEAGQPPAVALWGDSHASVYSVMLGELAAERNQSVRVFTMPACPPLIGWTDSGQAWREQCERFQALAFEELRASPSIHTVMLAGRFAGYPHDQPDSGFSAAMRGTIEALRSAGKRVALVHPAPELGAHVPEVLSRSIMAGESPEEKAQPRSRFEETFKRELDFLNRLGDEEGVLDIRPDRRLCDAESCYFYKDGVVYYYDDNHLSLSGAEIAKPEFRAVFDPPDRAASEPPGGPVRR